MRSTFADTHTHTQARLNGPLSGTTRVSRYRKGKADLDFTEVRDSALTLLVGRQERHPACKKLSGGLLAWLSVWSEVQTCMAQLMPLPLTVSCFSKIQIGFTFLVPAHLGCPGKGPLDGCVCNLFIYLSN